MPVDPDADEEAKEEERRSVHRGEESHLGGRRLQRDGGGELDGQPGESAAEDRDRLPGPELLELAVASE